MWFLSFIIEVWYTVVVATVRLNVYFKCKKILKFIFFRKRSDSSRYIFLENKFLSVFEIHVYEILKFVIRAVTKSLSQSFLNDLFSFEKKTRATRLSKTKLLAEPICRKKNRSIIRSISCYQGFQPSVSAKIDPRRY